MNNTTDNINSSTRLTRVSYHTNTIIMLLNRYHRVNAIKYSEYRPTVRTGVEYHTLSIFMHGRGVKPSAKYLRVS